MSKILCALMSGKNSRNHLPTTRTDDGCLDSFFRCLHTFLATYNRAGVKMDVLILLLKIHSMAFVWPTVVGPDTACSQSLRTMLHARLSFCSSLVFQRLARFGPDAREFSTLCRCLLAVWKLKFIWGFPTWVRPSRMTFSLATYSGL